MGVPRFLQRRPTATRHAASTKWKWSVKQIPDHDSLLYRLPAICCGLITTTSVFITEGEKDADNLAKLGLTATCNIGGAGKWRAEYVAVFPPQARGGAGGQ